MELTDIRSLVLAADPSAKHYEHGGDGPYTTWQETRRLAVTADDVHVRGWAFVIDHFTDVEFSEVAQAIEQVLSEAEGVAYSYVVDYEQDTGIIHHAFSCEGY